MGEHERGEEGDDMKGWGLGCGEVGKGEGLVAGGGRFNGWQGSEAPSTGYDRVDSAVSSHGHGVRVRHGG